MTVKSHAISIVQNGMSTRFNHILLDILCDLHVYPTVVYREVFVRREGASMANAAGSLLKLSAGPWF